MPQINVYNMDGESAGTMELPDAVFGVEANAALLYQARHVATVNARKPLAHTKDRSEVRGGGRKPWAQKGTGRARHGSIRSPLWKGGGVTFGPRIESITKRSIPAKMRKSAMRAVLSDRVGAGKFVVIDGFDALATPSTKKLSALLAALKLTSKKVLFLADAGLENAVLSLRNLPRTKSARPENINILDLLSHGTIMTSKGAVNKLIVQLS